MEAPIFTEKRFYVYVIECFTPGKRYVGITSNFPARILAHKEKRGSYFTRRHGAKAARIVGIRQGYGLAQDLEKQTVINFWKQGLHAVGGPWSSDQHMYQGQARLRRAGEIP